MRQHGKATIIEQDNEEAYPDAADRLVPLSQGGNHQASLRIHYPPLTHAQGHSFPETVRQRTASHQGLFLLQYAHDRWDGAREKCG